MRSRMTLRVAAPITIDPIAATSLMASVTAATTPPHASQPFRRASRCESVLQPASLRVYSSWSA
eukprot:1648497-Prymnesium_polylepis.2